MSDGRRKVYDRTIDNYLLLCDNEDMEYEAYKEYNRESGMREMLYRTKIVNITNPERIRDNYYERRNNSKSNYNSYSGSVAEWVEPTKEFGLVDVLQKETDNWLKSVQKEED